MATNINIPAPALRAPWYFWLVGLLGLVWNAYGAFDYFMSKTRGDAYFASVGMTPAQLDYYHAMPVWMTVVWAIGVWGAVLGSVLLLLRSRHALPVFVASLVAYVVSVLRQDFIAPMPGNSTLMMVVQAVIFAGCVFFVWYSRWTIARGWVR
jgi:hypothetical protein